MSTYRIIRRTSASGSVMFKVQAKGWFGRWNDMPIQPAGGHQPVAWYDTMEEAFDSIVAPSDIAGMDAVVETIKLL